MHMARGLGVGTLSNPGPGFVLFCSALILGVLPIVLVPKALLGKGERRRLADSWRSLKWQNVLVTVIALFLYASFPIKIGFLIMTFTPMILIYALGKPKPWITLTGAFVTISLANVTFHLALQVQFPRGMLG